MTTTETGTVIGGKVQKGAGASRDTKTCPIRVTCTAALIARNIGMGYVGTTDRIRQSLPNEVMLMRKAIATTADDPFGALARVVTHPFHVRELDNVPCLFQVRLG
jgi:hypothetical protein